MFGWFRRKKRAEHPEAYTFGEKTREAEEILEELYPDRHLPWGALYQISKVYDIPYSRLRYAVRRNGYTIQRPEGNNTGRPVNATAHKPIGFRKAA